MRAVVILKLAVVLAALVCLSSDSSHGAEPQSQRDQVLKFLKAHLIGKTLVIPETSGKIDNDKAEIVASSTMSYTNLVETKFGLSFDVTTVTRQTNYDLGKDGKRQQPGHVKDYVESCRLEFSLRPSTGQLIGLNRTLTTTAEGIDVTGYALAARLELRDGGLELFETSVLYDELFVAGDKTTPGAIEQLTRFTIVDGKIQGELSNKAFDVDPATLKRTPKDEPSLKAIMREAPAAAKVP